MHLEENKGLVDDVGLNGQTQEGGELSTGFLKNNFPSFQDIE